MIIFFICLQAQHFFKYGAHQTPLSYKCQRDPSVVYKRDMKNICGIVQPNLFHAHRLSSLLLAGTDCKLALQDLLPCLVRQFEMWAS